MEYLNLILSALGGGTIVLAVAAFLGRKFLDVQLLRVTEKFKDELQQKSSILKTELSIYAHEQNVGISRLDQQRSEAICEIYGVVTKWHGILMELTGSEPELPDELLVKNYYNLSISLIDSAGAITKVLYNRAIFFQNSSYKLIGDFGIQAMELSCNFYDITFAKADYPSVYAQDMLKIIRQERVLLSDRFRGDFDNAREQLIQEFRLLLKVERQ